MAAKGIEQRHLLLLHQSVLLSVTDCGLGLTTMAPTNLLKLDRVQSEAMPVVVGTTKESRPPTTANRTESGAGQSVLQRRGKKTTTHSKTP